MRVPKRVKRYLKYPVRDRKDDKLALRWIRRHQTETAAILSVKWN